MIDVTVVDPLWTAAESTVEGMRREYLMADCADHFSDDLSALILVAVKTFDSSWCLPRSKKFLKTFKAKALQGCSPPVTPRHVANPNGESLIGAEAS